MLDQHRWCKGTERDKKEFLKRRESRADDISNQQDAGLAPLTTIDMTGPGENY